LAWRRLRKKRQRVAARQDAIALAGAFVIIGSSSFASDLAFFEAEIRPLPAEIVKGRPARA
jgi:hypothetical protein